VQSQLHRNKKFGKIKGDLADEYKLMEDVIKNGDYDQLKENKVLHRALRDAGNLLDQQVTFGSDYAYKGYNAAGQRTMIGYDIRADKYSVAVHGTKVDDLPISRAYPDKTKNQIKEKLKMTTADCPEFCKTDKDVRAYAAMVLTMRTMITGRPHFTGLDQDANNLLWMESGDLTFKNGKKLSRYPNAKSPLTMMDGRYPVTTHNPPPTSVFNCLDASDALVDYANRNATDKTMFIDNLKPGQNIVMDQSNIENINYSTMDGRDDKRRSKGWICTACGSGIHVDPNGQVHWETRDRVGNNLDKRSSSFVGSQGSAPGSKEAIHAARDNDLSMGSLLNLPTYIIPNCKGCNCLKGLNKNDFKAKLNDSKTIRHHMVTQNDKGEHVINEKPYTIKDSKSCVFVPPVPHSCTYRPDGNSKGENNLQEIKDKLYCELRDKIKSFPSRSVANSGSMQKTCEELDKFPQTEEDCYPHLRPAGKMESSSSNNSSVQQEN
jgi:hypothetical protein